MLRHNLDLWHFSPEPPRGIVGHGVWDSMPMQLLLERPEMTAGDGARPGLKVRLALKARNPSKWWL